MLLAIRYTSALKHPGAQAHSSLGQYNTLISIAGADVCNIQSGS